jgi:hypothetical protein
MRSPHATPRQTLAGGGAGLPCWAGCCAIQYYVQAAQGQYALWSDARPSKTGWAIPARIPHSRRGWKALLIRRFAVQELGLPDNASYRNYAALSRPFVLWNVVATPEFSLVPLRGVSPLRAVSAIAAITARTMRKLLLRVCARRQRRAGRRRASLFHAWLVQRSAAVHLIIIPMPSWRA